MATIEERLEHMEEEMREVKTALAGSDCRTS